MTARIPLTKGYFAVVVDEDAARVLGVGKWYAGESPRGHIYAIHPARTPSRLHTFLTGYELTDHVDGCGLNNTRANLREATYSQNAGNAALRSTSRTGYKGVTARGASWRATFRHDRLGSFPTPEDAARAYDVAARKALGEFARLNFPLPGEQSVKPADYSLYQMAANS